jgi:DNA-binding beta-propeller fold protein YncE
VGRQGPDARPRIPTGKTPSHIYIDSRSTVAYVTMQDSDELVAIDLSQQRIRWRIKTGPMPADVFGTPDDRKVLVGLTGSDSVQIFDVSYVEVPRAVASSAPARAPTPSAPPATASHVFLSNRVANTISKIDLRRCRWWTPTPRPGGPDCMECWPAAAT